jgi:hypothetical protein
MEAPPSFQAEEIREVWGSQTQCMGLKSQFYLGVSNMAWPLFFLILLCQGIVRPQGRDHWEI